MGQLVRRDIAQDAHRQPRPREGVAVEDIGGNVQQPGHFPHLVLEQEFEGLDDPALLLQFLHFAHAVVVGLDGLRRALDRVAFDHVGIERALDEKIKIPEAAEKYIDEGLADDLAFPFRGSDPFQVFQERTAGIDIGDLQPQAPAQVVQDLFFLVQAQQAVVDENGGNLVPQRPVQQHRQGGGVDAAAHAQHHALAQAFLPQQRDLVFDEIFHAPGAVGPGDGEKEIGQDPFPFLAVHDLGMELHGEDLAAAILDGGDGAVGGAGGDLVAWSGRGDRIAVAHPDRAVVRHVFETRGSRP